MKETMKDKTCIRLRPEIVAAIRSNKRIVRELEDVMNRSPRTIQYKLAENHRDLTTLTVLSYLTKALQTTLENLTTDTLKTQKA